MRSALLRGRVRAALSRRSRRSLRHCRPAAMPAFLPVALVPGYLAAMERPGYDPFKTAVEVPQWRRQWVLWRAARRYSRRHARLSRDIGEHRLADLLLAHHHQRRAVAQQMLRLLLGVRAGEDAQVRADAARLLDDLSALEGVGHRHQQAARGRRDWRPRSPPDRRRCRRSSRCLRAFSSSTASEVVLDHQQRRLRRPRARAR